MNEREIFIAARQKPNAAERAAFLDEACAGDPDLRQHVQTLLREHEQLGSFLESPAQALVATAADPKTNEGPGTVIGPYRLLEQIGEGGFGVVFLAEQQQPVRRRVALKVLKPGMDSRSVIARFEAERGWRLSPNRPRSPCSPLAHWACSVTAPAADSILRVERILECQSTI